MSDGSFTKHLEILGKTEYIPCIVPDKRGYDRRFDRHYTCTVGTHVLSVTDVELGGWGEKEHEYLYLKMILPSKFCTGLSH